MKNFAEKRNADVASFLLTLAGGRLNYTALLKLLHIADHKSLLKYHSLITESAHSSLPNGPLASDIYDMIKEESVSQQIWDKYFKTSQFDIIQIAPSDGDYLSITDKEILTEVFKEFGDWHYSKLIDYTHENCPEWDEPEPGGKQSTPIKLDSLLRGARLAEEEAKEVEVEIMSHRAMQKALQA